MTTKTSSILFSTPAKFNFPQSDHEKRASIAIESREREREREREKEQVSLVAAFIKIDWLRPRDSISNTRYIKGIESRESRANIMKRKEMRERERKEKKKLRAP